MTSAARPRTAIRPLTPDDVATVEPWYAEAVATARGLRDTSEPIDLRLEFADAEAAGSGMLSIERGGEVIGVLDYRIKKPSEGWSTIGFLALAAAHRGWGYGSDAVRAFEAQAGARHYLANVDRRNGLGLYFWLRLGYHPARAGEAFWRAPDENDTMAMVRASNK